MAFEVAGGIAVNDAQATINALAGPQALPIFGVIVAGTPKARVRDRHGNQPTGTS